MLVWGPGTPLTGGDAGVSLSNLGVDFKGETFASEVKMWVCDQADISVRIDVSIGTISSLVLDAEMGSDNNITGGAVTARSEVVGRSEVGRPFRGRGSIGTRWSFRTGRAAAALSTAAPYRKGNKFHHLTLPSVPGMAIPRLHCTRKSHRQNELPAVRRTGT